MQMKQTIGCALALVMAAGVNGALAQGDKAAEVIAKTRKALGGAKLDAVKTLSVAAATQRNLGQMQISGDLEIALELPDRYLKAETSRGGLSGLTINSGFNGDQAILPANVSVGSGGTMVFRRGPSGPVADAPKLTDEQRAQLNTTSLRSARADLSRMMLGWFGTTHPSLQAQYTYAGEAESPDGKAHVIDVTDAGGFETRLLIDQKNYLPLMVTYKGRQPRMVTQTRSGQLPDAERMKREMAEAPLVEFALFFDDWREVSGITFPHMMRRAVAGETTEEWTISKVTVNPKFDSKKFDTAGK